MKMRILHFSFLVVFILSLDRLIAAEPAPSRITVELRDGSRVVGQSLDKKLRFHSQLLGELALSVQDIRSLDFSSTNTATLTTSTGDALTVSFMDSAVAIKTSFGKVDLPVDSILKVTVAATVPGSTLPGLVALWQGDGAGKDIAGDHDGSVSPGITYIAAKTGQGFYFDGGANRILVPNAADLNFGPGKDFSIEAWIEPEPAPPQMTDDILPIVEKRETPNRIQTHGYELIVWHGKLHFRMSDDIRGNGGDWSAPAPDLMDGEFHQVAVTVVRNSPDGGKLYVDGKLVLTFDPTSEPGDLSNSQPLRIGNHSNPDYYSFFHGLIDNVAIYNRALSSEEIKSLCLKDNAGVALPPGHMRALLLQPRNNGIYDYPDHRWGIPGSAIPGSAIP